MGACLSKFEVKHLLSGGVSLSIIFWFYRLYRNVKGSIRHASRGKETSNQEKAVVNVQFFVKLKKILAILIPKLISPECGYLVVVAVSLVLRSLCDIWMIRNNTLIESSIIGGNKIAFKKHLFSYITAMPLISVTNNVLKLGVDELKLRFRSRLTVHLFDLYLRDLVYYKVTQLDSRISNIDQLITQDVDKFCNSIANVYTNLSKPLLDILIYVQRISATIGGSVPFLMMCYLVLSGLLLTYLRQPLGRMTVMEQGLEGEYRFVNSRLVTYAEEIAFYKGNHKEKKSMMDTFSAMVNHYRKLISFRFSMGFLDNIVAKYVATTVGFLLVSRPFMKSTGELHLATHGERLESYYRTGRMMLKLAQAIGRLVLAGREMTKLSGFTIRVDQLLQTLADVSDGHYERNGSSAGRKATGVIVKADNIIKFEDVPLITPTGDVLVERLNFEVSSGTNVLVCGPNGCGKSSLFRIIGGLWPLYGGVLTKPGSNKLFYIPQKPYMTIGTLRDQVIYPHCQDDAKCTDAELENYLSLVKLEYILEREGNWNVTKDWADVLSGGEKQRIAMARMFYHQPLFAILDECTSAVSADVEDSMYSYCKSINITLLTVSHRKSLWKHHAFYLHLDGRGAFTFKSIDCSTEPFGS